MSTSILILIFAVCFGIFMLGAMIFMFILFRKKENELEDAKIKQIAFLESIKCLKECEYCAKNFYLLRNEARRLREEL